MAAPTTKSQPSPKSPSVCKKGTIPPGAVQLLPDQRTLTAQIAALLAQTGLPSALIATVTLDPLPTPGEWGGDTLVDGVFVDVALNKNPDGNTYDVELELSTGTTVFYYKSWTDTTPRVQEPVEFADLHYKDPSTGDDATLTIMS